MFILAFYGTLFYRKNLAVICNIFLVLFGPYYTYKVESELLNGSPVMNNFSN